MADLQGVGFDGVFSSLPWWDRRAQWLVQEQQRLLHVAPVIAPVADLDVAWTPSAPTQGTAALRRDLQIACFIARHTVVPLELARIVGRLALQELTSTMSLEGDGAIRLSLLSGPWASVTALLRKESASTPGQVLLINPDDAHPVAVDMHTIEQRLPGRYRLVWPNDNRWRADLSAAACRVLALKTNASIALPVASADPGTQAAESALQAGRIAIEHISPVVDGGRFPIKRIRGQAIYVQADVYMDGHDQIDAEVLYKPVADDNWSSVPMQHVDNDRWQGVFYAAEPGLYCYTVRAWLDVWSSHQEVIRKKTEAGQDIALEQLEAKTLGGPGERRFVTQSTRLYPLLVERREAQFGSWYEMFPRSQSPTPGQHGSFRDVEQRLPAVRAMGFDVLYFPPIHPIGLQHRKGRNNALQAQADDPGSPYAIGSWQGGHDAIHPELGTLVDFLHLVRAAHAHDMEIALDFAIQCSPDHPWLAQHPAWFDWRADGSLRVAENPPKRYEDIVNPDFYSPGADQGQRAALWVALRDIVLFWAAQGVRIFRVDNPHTKPLPFWEWMLAEVRQRYPDTVFLSEAFTRPKMMYRLAKAGFSQSYTYFIWRNTKQELTDYLTELNTPPVADFFRPHFFVNTPDINPYFLQQSGRAGFLIRAALATTLSGLWGMYNGFELCESRALPGREEYADSEKYQLRAWDMTRPGNIIAEITRLNQIRRENPALQSHLGLRFHQADNDQILFFSKSSEAGDSMVLVAVSLNPHGQESGWLHFPFWLFKLRPGGRPTLRQLYDDQVFALERPDFYIQLPPERPFAIWRLEPGPDYTGQPWKNV
ncbi:MAG: alpha-1,4-glucan--maltose-1-phosphate maltosyltransferase [Burkholderiaceae bacterium]|nr:alpha-1,4-glucan--maltose-1-phosphate maltosyltransferase [Burkholderiaceae bacterium]